jgi:hypothetical protein
MGGSEWQPVQLFANIVATSQGTPVAAPAPASPDPLLDPPELLAPELLDAPEPLDPPELLDPLDPPEEDAPEEDEPTDASPGLLGPHPGTTITFSSVPEEHAAAMARAAAPNTESVLTEGAVTRRAGKQADQATIFPK